MVLRHTKKTLPKRNYCKPTNQNQSCIMLINLIMAYEEYECIAKQKLNMYLFFFSNSYINKKLYLTFKFYSMHF